MHHSNSAVKAVRWAWPTPAHPPATSQPLLTFSPTSTSAILPNLPTHPASSPPLSTPPPQTRSHYCHPSAPQIWLYILQQTLLSHGVQPLPFPKGPVRERNACAQVFEKDQGKLGAPKPVDRVMAEAKEREERERRQRRPFFRYMTTFLSGRR